MALHRVRVTVEKYGRDEEAAERFLGGFIATHPEVGPVVSQDTVADTMSVVFAIDAEDEAEALDEARTIFFAGVRKSGLRSRQGSKQDRKPVEVTVSRVDDPEESAAEREFEFA